MSSPVARFDLATQARMLAAGEVSSRELVECSLERIAATRDTVNAFRVVRAAEALLEADAADERLRAGGRAPLLGVPVAVKDDVDVAGQSTPFGCDGPFPPVVRDGEMVRRLREAGAVIVGKTNSPEVGLYPFTETRAFGATRNPWNLQHTPGGSSGGSAAAVAAGIVAGALGSDGAGSVRIPAAWCHLVGVKPQRGRISTWPDVGAFNGLSCIGPITRTVADAALLLDVLCGSHPDDRHAPPPPAVAYVDAIGSAPERLRVGVSLRPAFSGAPVSVHEEIRQGAWRVARVLEELGHRVLSARPRYRLMGATLVARGQAGVHEWARRVPDRGLLDRRTLAAARAGGVFSRTILPPARGLEARTARRVGAVFEHADVLLTPTTARPPMPIGAAEGLGSWATDQLIASSCPYAWPWNVLGWPAVSVPGGVTRKGLPFGVQLLGPANSEGLLLALAAQLETVERWGERKAPGVL